MTSPISQFAPLRFSTTDFPEHDRVAIWREVIGRKIVRIDIEPLGEHPFQVEATLRGLPELGIMSAEMSPFRLERSPGLVADGNDDLRLAVNLSGREIVFQRGREALLDPGDAVLVSMGECGSIVRPSAGRRIGFNIPRKAIASLVADIDATCARSIPRDTPALRLLIAYLGILRDETALATPQLRRAVAFHIHDLVALAIGATKDAQALVQGRGARAARLHAIKADVVANLGRGDLSIEVVAQRHHLGVRYVQRLFESDGTTFSDFVLTQRLARARRMLADSRFMDQRVGDIAEACGFADASYFGRRFRQFFSATPSDIRAEAAKQGSR